MTADTCYGCRSLQFYETKHHLFGWWECDKLPKNNALVGRVGGYDRVCEHPQRCANWRYYLDGAMR